MHVHVTILIFNMIMEKQISDAESVNSGMSSSVGSSIERLKAPTYQSEVQSLKVIGVCDE